MGVRNVFTSLLVRRGGPVTDAILRELLPDVSFMDRATRRLWTALTGDSVSSPKDVWVPYQRHVERRNRIAHGIEWGDSHSAESVAAAGAFIVRLDAAMERHDASTDRTCDG